MSRDDTQEIVKFNAKRLAVLVGLLLSMATPVAFAFGLPAKMRDHEDRLKRIEQEAHETKIRLVRIEDKLDWLRIEMEKQK